MWNSNRMHSVMHSLLGFFCLVLHVHAWHFFPPNLLNLHCTSSLFCIKFLLDANFLWTESLQLSEIDLWYFNPEAFLFLVRLGDIKWHTCSQRLIYFLTNLPTNLSTNLTVLWYWVLNSFYWRFIFDTIKPLNYSLHTLQMRQDIWADKKFNSKVIKPMSPRVRG